MEEGWVYIVTNRAIDGLVKVGYTKRPDLDKRLREFNQAGLPYPYESRYAVWVADPRGVEKTVHQALAAHRENKEWFRCSVEDAQRTIEKVAGLHRARSERDMERRRRETTQNKDRVERETPVWELQHEERRRMLRSQHQTYTILFWTLLLPVLVSMLVSMCG